MAWSEAIIAVGVLIIMVGAAFAAFVLIKVNGQDIDPCGINDEMHKRICDQIAIIEIVNLVDDFAHCKIIDHQTEGGDGGMQMNETTTMKMLEIRNATSSYCQNVIGWFLGQNWTMVPENTSKVFLVK